jgi:hypothetical protein
MAVRTSRLILFSASYAAAAHAVAKARICFHFFYLPGKKVLRGELLFKTISVSVSKYSSTARLGTEP